MKAHTLRNLHTFLMVFLPIGGAFGIAFAICAVWFVATRSTHSIVEGPIARDTMSTGAPGAVALVYRLDSEKNPIDTYHVVSVQYGPHGMLAFETVDGRRLFLEANEWNVERIDRR